MDKDLQKRVKEIAVEVAESADDIKFVEAGADLIIPDTLASGGVSSGKDKGRTVTGGKDINEPESDIRIPPGREDDDGPEADGLEKDGPQLPKDDPDAPKTPKKEAGKYGGKAKGGQPGQGEQDGEGEESEEDGDEDGDGTKGKGKGKGKSKRKADEGEEGEEEEGDGDEDGDEGEEKKRKLKKGDKVVIKPKSLPGVVTEINDDGTIKVRELEPAEIMDLGSGVFSHGGKTQGVDVQLFNVGGSVPATKEDDYEEDELELIEDQKKPPKQSKQPKTPPPPPPPPPPNGPQADLSEYLERLNLLKNRKFKLPALAKEMFFADLDPNNIFYKYQAPLVLHNRYAKSAFSKTKPMGDNELNDFSEFVRDFPSFVLFCSDLLEYRNGGYYIVSDQQFNIIVGMGTLEASLDDVESAIQSGDPQAVMVVEMVLEFLENQFVLDYQYYRILSLTPFIKPEYFSDNWIKPHLDYVFNYFRASELGFCNIPTAPFNTSLLDNESLYTMMTQNLSVYNIVRATMADDYKIYVFEDIKPIDQNIPSSKVVSRIISDEELSNIEEITEPMAASLMAFYQYSGTLRKSYDYKEITLKNLQKLSNLQMESYLTLLRDVDLQISIYGF